MLDLDLFDISSIAEAVVENMVITDQLSREHSQKVLAALLSRHRHQHQQQQPSLRRKFSFSSLSTHSMDAAISDKNDVEMGKEENNVVTEKYRILSDSETSSFHEVVDGRTVVCTIISIFTLIIRIHWDHAKTVQTIESIIKSIKV